MNTVVVVLAGCVFFAFGVHFVRDFVPAPVLAVSSLLGLLIPPVGLVVALVRLRDGAPPWPALALCGVLFVAGGFGLTVGYHRLLTHASFKTGPRTKFVLLVLGSIGLGSKPIDFAATHLRHHAHSDRMGDPHSPRDGFLHAHALWLVDARRPHERERYCRKLLADPVVRLVDRTAYGWFLLGVLGPLAIAGLDGFLWAGLVRIALQLNITLGVNSFCHRFGSQPYETHDDSRNNLPMALLSFGEGWHNNHHAFPALAYHGHGLRQPDLSALLIRLLARLGFAWDVKEPSSKLLERKRRATPVSVNPKLAPTTPGSN
jgi:stearoyl-CoA desaturase (delta-9 desaturase)